MSSLKPWRSAAEVSSLSWVKYWRLVYSQVIRIECPALKRVQDSRDGINLGNIIVSTGTPVAIDNAFRPELVSTFLKQEQGHWGRILTGYQVGSVAAANEQLAFQEAGLLFDVFLDTAGVKGDARTNVEQSKGQCCKFIVEAKV